MLVVYVFLVWSMLTTTHTTSFIAGLSNKHSQCYQKQRNGLSVLQRQRSVRYLSDNPADIGTKEEDAHAIPHLIFPGGGIFFYWQAGAVTFLRENGYDLSAVTMTGASAGALTATLAMTGVDFMSATKLALSLAAESGVWDRGSGGLQGVWGPLIREWLDALLPINAVERVHQKLAILITPMPDVFGKEAVHQFRDRDDLISANVASVHLPWFLDSKLTATFRNRPYIDGSFLASAKDYEITASGRMQHSRMKPLILDYNLDPKYARQNLFSFVEAVSPEGIYNIMDDGKRYARIMEERGMFSLLPKLQGQNTATT